ncbi:MAG: hypothetical protein MUE36_02695 [Acidimicrobiales bacterium]|jgi:hypothetical protein|nr:hypothetical protein [Acidimicrobiales bacterium]
MTPRRPGGDPGADDGVGPGDGRREEVRLEVPAESRFARLMRIAVSALAVRRGFDVSVVEDLRIAVDESLILLLRAVPSGGGGGTPTDGDPVETTMVLTLREDGGEIDIGLRVVPPPVVEPDDAEARDALSRFTELVPPRVVVTEVDPARGYVALELTRA